MRAAALDAACAVQDEWATHPPRERGEILRRAFEAMVANADDLALVMTLEMGKPLAESKAEITYAAEFLRWFSEEAVRIEGRFATVPERRRPADHDEAARRPVPTRSRRGTSRPRWARARSARRSPRAARWSSSPRSRRRCAMLALAKIFQEAGLPDGVLNVVTSSTSSATSRSRSSATRGCAS